MAEAKEINVSIKESEAQAEKMKIPLDVQKSMMEFFMRTSIPRKKAQQLNNENHLSTKEKDR